MDKSFAVAVRKILYLQLAMAVSVSVLFWLVLGGLEGQSALFGGLAAFLPNVYFALRVGRARGAEAKGLVRAFYAGEAGKLLLTALLFVLIFQFADIHFLSLLAGFVSVIAIFWVALLMRN